MEITFTRIGERDYATVAVRDDGVTVRVPAFDRPSVLPHDLAHYVVEHELGIADGFWGCVAAGALFPGMVVERGRQRPRPAARSREIVRRAGQRGTEAEVLVGVMVDIVHDDLDSDSRAVLERLRRMWQPGSAPRPVPALEEVRRVCALLREVTTQWQSLAVGESMTVTWGTLPSRGSKRAFAARRGERLQR